jgi:DNA mismatch repair protein MutL
MITRRITVLPESIANKIAAGEVVQRPESVVKELLENSLDAGAASLRVVITEGGKKMIQVADDGMGMDETDAIASFGRHATSKILAYEDLEAIQTFGFRGEALASIAAVAQVTMKTRTEGDDAAVVVRIDGGKAARIDREARERGTTVTVNNLFFNVPARRKFLKSPATEFRHVYEAVHRVALSHPDVALRFISGNETIFDLAPSSEARRVLDLFGTRQMEALLPVEERNAMLRIHGYIGKPAFGLKTRAQQYVFLNRRPILSRTVSHAAVTAYENLLVRGTFPFFLLFLDIDPHRVDVNVHPSKMEAKFDDEQAIHHLVSALVRRGLAGGDAAVPSLTLDGRDASAEAGGGLGLRFGTGQHSWPGTVDVRTGEILEVPRQPSPAAPLGGMPGTTDATDSGAASWETGGPIWQLHRKYILSAVRDGVMIVDQHVAHERILYERATQRFAASLATTQELLFPVTLQLSAADYALLTELSPHFAALGFQIKPFGKNTAVVEGVPPDVKGGMEERIVGDILALYKENQAHATMDARDALAKSYSCKAAIKAGDPLTEPEMRGLLDQLFTTTMPYVCPHGRPVVLRISTEEFDRRFGRV